MSPLTRVRWGRRRDSLTGLLSRRGLLAEIDKRAGAGSDGRAEARRRFALLLVDLDRFKNVNDGLGHAVGDRLLIEVGRRLTTAVRRGDLIARMGADEFAILAPAMFDVDTASRFAGHVVAVLRESAYVDGLPLDMSASVGVALCPEHGRDADELVRNADTALQEAKLERGSAIVYSRHSDPMSPERLSLLADLRLALEEPSRKDEIAFHYQPQVATRSQEVVGLEALLRWQHPRRGSVNPGEVVSAAERSTVMHLLTMRAFDDVVGQLAAWNAHGVELRASVNVSMRDLQTPILAKYIAAALHRSGISADQIEVEITETALMTDPQPVLASAEQLADLGIRIALDDFGTGYSSLQHLRRLPLSELKIDQSFVQAMVNAPDAHAIVRAVIGLAHALDLRVVAEGVADEATHKMLATLDCDIEQGWYHAAAMPADEVAGWLEQRSHRAVR